MGLVVEETIIEGLDLQNGMVIEVDCESLDRQIMEEVESPNLNQHNLSDIEVGRNVN